MITSSNIKYLLSDRESLLKYQKCIDVNYEEVRWRMYLLEREKNISIPDHYYKLNEEWSFRGIKSLSGILSTGIVRLAEEHLELKGKRVYVKQEKQNDWQELITFIPPLILVSFFLTNKRRIDLSSPEDIRSFYAEWILPNTLYTALPSPYFPQLEMYVKENNGFHDLHMHLNGATETDMTWQDFLFEYETVYKNMEEGFKNPLVREQYEQEGHGITPVEYRKLLQSAMRLRQFFYNYICENRVPGEKTDIHSVLLEINSGDSGVFPTRIYHPFYELIYPGFEETDYNRRCLLSIEGLMYALLFNRLTDKPHEELAQLFHYYLLILGYTNRLLVQQTHQYGFTQFQKLTLNELREQSEFHYRNRFFQLQGNNLRNIHVLEGRFAPKDTRDGVLQLLKRIRGGWKELVDHVANTGVQPELKLAAHFIKRADDKENQDIRHKSLRYKVWNQALILAYMKKNQPKELTDVVAVDAAASEFDASPEVFAPAFRILRRKGFNHFTYHAGEDFFHILTGLRSIYEAVVFNDLRSGDRIGHATATGISPSVWKANVGSTILMRRGEYLDDLVFVYHLIMERVKKNPRLEAFKSKIPFLANHIQEYGSFIYHVYAPLKVYENAWMLRKYCPMTLKTQSLELESAWQVFWSDNPLKPAEEMATFDFEEWCEIREEVQEPVTDESVRLLMKYHNQGYHEKYNEIIEVNIEECFTLKEIELLQLAILDFLHEKEIVIETLPTSNVRIGHHSSFHTYHLWNWLQWEKQGHSIPPIVVGTDDTGIFATNIFNEFANIYCFLTHTKKLSHNHAMEIIQRLERNARIYRFE